MTELERAIVAEMQKKWPDQSVWQRLYQPLRKGSEKPGIDGITPDCRFARAKSNNKPEVIGPDKRPLTDQSKIYGGCYARASVTAYAFENETKGVALALNNVMKTRDGEPFGSRTNAADDFANVESAAGGADALFGKAEQSDTSGLFGNNNPDDVPF